MLARKRNNWGRCIALIRKAGQTMLIKLICQKRRNASPRQHTVEDFSLVTTSITFAARVLERRCNLPLANENG